MLILLCLHIYVFIFVYICVYDCVYVCVSVCLFYKSLFLPMKYENKMNILCEKFGTFKMNRIDKETVPMNRKKKPEKFNRKQWGKKTLTLTECINN